MDSSGELGGLIEVETGGKERGAEEEPGEILDGPIGFIGGSLGLR